MPGLPIEDAHLQVVAKLVYDTSGIVFKDSNLTVLSGRLTSKLRDKNVTIEEYIRLLKTNNAELMSFIDFVTTNFTRFFRNIRHFEIFTEMVLPLMLERKKKRFSRTMKIWSAGCSTGEEAYTIAILVYEFLKDFGIQPGDLDVQVLASDISLDSLFIAKAGKYPRSSVDKVEDYYKNKYFEPVEDGSYYMVKEEIRKMVRFDFHNLIYDSPFNMVDIAFCRNVMIYFDETVQHRVVEKIHQAMVPGACLFIGHSETLVGIHDGFKPQSVSKGILYVRK